MLKISEKTIEKQRKCAQISPSAFLSIAPFKLKETLKQAKTLKNSEKTAKKNFNFFFVEALLHGKENCL
jgi:hypothetical protein